MATVTIKVFDNEDGDVGVHVEFDPPLRKSDQPTGAQAMAALMVKAAQDAGDDDGEGV